MGAFVGRKEELEYLEAVYSKTPVACAVCGRRHLGKTAMLSEFCKGKEHLYITGMPGLKDDNLRQIGRALSEFGGRPVRLDGVEDLFPALKRVCFRKRVVVVIDCYSDLVGNFPELTSYLRMFMSRDINSTGIMMVVCDTDSSIFGRFYYNLEVKAMSYRDCIGFHPGYTPLEHLTAYSIVGGTPAYQRLFSGPPGDVIRDQFFDHMSVFSLEAESMVDSEIEMRSECVKALSAMAAGAESIKDIASSSDLGFSVCSKVVEDMEHKGLLRREVSSGPSRRAVYTIHSNLIRFFYEVVRQCRCQVEFGNGPDAYRKAEPEINAFLERSFKEICLDYVTMTYRYSFAGKLRREDDSADPAVDFVAAVYDGGRSLTAVATCRLFGEPLDAAALQTLRRRGGQVAGPERVHMMFSGCGFARDLRDAADGDPSVRLFTLDDLYAADRPAVRRWGHRPRGDTVEGTAPGSVSPFGFCPPQALHPACPGTCSRWTRGPPASARCCSVMTGRR